MKDFLSNYGLYKEFVIHENIKVSNKKYTLPHDFVGETFDYKCEVEDEIKTFELELDKATDEYYDSFMKLEEELFIDKKLDYTFKVLGKCRSCKEYHIEFLLHVYSDNEVSRRLISGRPIVNSSGMTKPKEYPDAKVFLEKVGSNPPIKVQPNKLVSKYFDRETNRWYFKGLNCINENYGIGAYAYFRRIIEKELIHIIESIKELPSSHKSEIEKLLKAHKENPTITTIYENIFEHLPHSLKVLGNNPIKLLYKETSDGLHSLKDDECLKKSEAVQKILEFTIQKINEEKSNIKDLRDLIKSIE